MKTPRKRLELEPLDLPESTGFLMTRDGVFTEGDLAIGREGMVINSPSTRPSSSRESASSRDVHNRLTFSCERRSSPATNRTDSTLLADGSTELTASYESNTINGAFGVSLDDLRDVCVIGHGSSATVRKVLHTGSKTFLALKAIQLDANSELVRKQVVTELKTLFKSSHPHIVNYHQSFFDAGCITIAMEYMDCGSLAHILKRHQGKPLREPHIAAIARQLLEGLSYLHEELRVVHRDIKPSNILVNRLGDLKISDFGVSGQLTASVSKCQSWVGTATYMSPERIKGESYSFDSDIWSVGLTIFECALGRFPYRSDSGTPLGFWDLLDLIVEAEAPTLPRDKYSPELCQFVMRCLAKDPKKRPSAHSLLNDPFLQKHAGEDASIADIAEVLVFPEEIRASGH